MSLETEMLKISNKYDFLAVKIPKKTYKNLYIGIDEAGRGPVLGYMNYCAFLTENIDDLKGRGLKDSKQLSEKTRENILKDLENNENLGFAIYCMNPKTLSANMNNGVSLNTLAYFCIEKILERILEEVGEIFSLKLDALGNCDKLVNFVKLRFKNKIKNVIAESKADDKYLEVSAASVVAKVSRDMLLKNFYSKNSQNDEISIKGYVEKNIFKVNEILDVHYKKNSYDKKFNLDLNFNSGYTSDPITVSWLKRNLNKITGFPDIVRFSWETSKKFFRRKNSKVKENTIRGFDFISFN